MGYAWITIWETSLTLSGRHATSGEQQFSRVRKGTGSPSVTTRALTDTAGGERAAQGMLTNSLRQATKVNRIGIESE